MNAAFPKDMHGPADQAPHVTYNYAVCEVCGVQWQVRSDVLADAQGCRFCNAPADRIRVLSEQPGTEGTVVR